MSAKAVTQFFQKIAMKIIGVLSNLIYYYMLL